MNLVLIEYNSSNEYTVKSVCDCSMSLEVYKM